MRRFLVLLYSARNHHRQIYAIDVALGLVDFDLLMDAAGISHCEELCQSECESSQENLAAGLPSLEPLLQVKHATLITKLEKEVGDDPEYACCCCERLHQRKNVTSMKKSALKFVTKVWQQLKKYILEQNNETEIDSLYVCQYCRPILNDNKVPSRCILNGLITEPMPAELAKLDVLSRQLIQRAKAFQTIVRLGTYTAKVPIYNSLKACKGTMFFLPLPLKKTLETLGNVKSVNQESNSLSQKSDQDPHVPLPDPELYIMVNGIPSEKKVIWRSIVDVSAVKTAIRKLREINWLYKEVADTSINEVAQQVIETADSATSTMLVKASKEDVSSFQSYTIRSLNVKQSTVSDIEQYKLFSVKEDALDNRQKFLDVMCFPHLFPSGRFGEFHPRELKISSSEYAKSRLLNKDSRFRKDPQYVFFLLWQKELRELSAGVYNLMKRTVHQRMSVQLFLDKVSHADESVEANVSTIFQSIRGTKQYWFLRSSELRCMLREWGTPTLFLTFSCAEYESPEIGSYLKKLIRYLTAIQLGNCAVKIPYQCLGSFLKSSMPCSIL